MWLTALSSPPPLTPTPHSPAHTLCPGSDANLSSNDLDLIKLGSYFGNESALQKNPQGQYSFL